MNEQTIKLLRELAEKLGTTADHLWAVLVKQAFISGCTNVIVICLLTVLLALLFKVLLPSMKKDNYCGCEYEFVYVTGWIFWGIATFVFLVIVTVEAQMIVASFFNPEYWALKQIVR